MFNRLKRKIIQEVIDELKSLCIECDIKTEEKRELNEDATFEAGVGYGLRKAIRKASDMKTKYK